MVWSIWLGYKDKRGLCMSISVSAKESGASLSQELNKRLKINAKNGLEVGFFETSKYPNGAYVASVAFWQEFGTLRIPMRPFFRNAIQGKANKWGAYLKNEIQGGLNTDLALARIGEVVKGDIVKSIMATNTPQNAPSTIKAKKSSKPLVDTGFLRASVNYKLKGK